MGLHFGRCYRYKPPSSDAKAAIVFWAEKGSIIIIDERYPVDSEKHLDVLSVSEWLHNLDALNKQLSRETYSDERNAIQNLIENGIACAREARRQGDPLNERHVRDMLLQRRKSMLFAGTGSRYAPGMLSNRVAPEAAALPPLSTYGRVVDKIED